MDGGKYFRKKNFTNELNIGFSLLSRKFRKGKNTGFPVCFALAVFFLLLTKKNQAQVSVCKAKLTGVRDVKRPITIDFQGKSSNFKQGFILLLDLENSIS